MAILGIGSFSLNPLPLANWLFASVSGSSLDADPAHEFLRYARMTPAERMRASILKDMGLNEAALDRMDPRTLSQVEAAIEERIEEKIEESQGPTGVFLDVSIS